MSSPRLTEWIAHVFDHPPAPKGWSKDERGPAWEIPSSELVPLISETFERSGELLSRFSDEQLGEGFWFLASTDQARYLGSLTDSVPWSVRQRGLRSMVELFRQVMAPRCTPVLSHLNESGRSGVNGACYMWFDTIEWWEHDRRTWAPDDADYYYTWRDPHDADFEAEVFEVLRQILAIPHDACRESAIHGLFHFQKWNVAASVRIIDEFLATTPNLRPELIDYAKRAREGKIQ